MKKMLTAYIDETYDKDIYFVGSILLNDNQINYINDQFSKLQKYINQKYSMPLNTEFHAYDIFQLKNELKKFEKKYNIPKTIYNLCLNIIVNSKGILFFNGVDKIRLQNRYKEKAYPPHQVALQYNLERLNEFALSCNQEIRIIADQVSDQSSHERQINHFKITGTPGYRSQLLSKIIMPFEWCNSKEHYCIQAIDLVLYVYRRYITKNYSHIKTQKTINKFWQKLTPIVGSRNIWFP
jgi:hypothetical protein